MYCEKGTKKPSSEEWLKQAKKSIDADKVGMYLVHNGVVRATAKEELYNVSSDHRIVKGMLFSADIAKANKYCEEVLKMPGVYYVRVWMAEGNLNVGDDIMQVLVGADTRPNCINALTVIVSNIKRECVVEKEIY